MSTPEQTAAAEAAAAQLAQDRAECAKALRGLADKVDQGAVDAVSTVYLVPAPPTDTTQRELAGVIRYIEPGRKVWERLAGDLVIELMSLVGGVIQHRMIQQIMGMATPGGADAAAPKGFDARLPHERGS